MTRMNRVGIGFDIHRLVRGRPFLLAGVRLPGPFGPEGHSDADPLSHAIVDALLGLDQIQKERVFFIALPVKLRRVTASWARAIALEELD